MQVGIPTPLSTAGGGSKGCKVSTGRKAQTALFFSPQIARKNAAAVVDEAQPLENAVQDACGPGPGPVPQLPQNWLVFCGRKFRGINGKTVLARMGRCYS